MNNLEKQILSRKSEKKPTKFIYSAKLLLKRTITYFKVSKNAQRHKKIQKMKKIK